MTQFSAARLGKSTNWHETKGETTTKKHDNLTDGKSREDASQAAGLSYKQTDKRVEQKTDDTKLSILQLEFECSEEIIGWGMFNVIVEEGQTGEGAHQTGRRLSAEWIDKYMLGN